MAKKNKINEYVNSYLTKELEEVKNSPIGNAASILSIEERTLIYKYTEDGYSAVNETLRKSNGSLNGEYGTLLDRTLGKLPNYSGLVYRSANLTAAELARYDHALENSEILVEHSFISTSKSAFIANYFGKNCRFNIICRTGKEIENYAKYGSYTGQNEKEVLFRPNRGFNILEITKKNNITFIIMEEVS